MFHKQTAEFIATVAQNMPEMSPDIMQGWIENPKALQKLLAGLNPPSNGSSLELKVWKTIKLGVGPTNADGFRCHLKDNKMRIGDYASDILGKKEFAVSDKETELDLVIMSIAELGFKKGATREQIYAKAKEIGLDLCPAEVGPQLRLQYKDQPNGEWFIIAMEPITGSGGDLGLFRVARLSDDLWLYTDCDYPDSVWDGYYRFVFVLPRK